MQARDDDDYSYFPDQPQDGLFTSSGYDEFANGLASLDGKYPSQSTLRLAHQQIKQITTGPHFRGSSASPTHDMQRPLRLVHSR